MMISPDLIFTDVVMPGTLSTREFVRQAQAMHPGILVLYTSGYTQNAIVHNGKLDDDALLLSKPYRKDELARKLRSVFAGTARGAIAEPKPAAAPRGKVLVVEDVALIRLTTMDMVQQLGFAAADAADAEEALAVLSRDSAIEILLTDLGLPGMNGRRLHENYVSGRSQDMTIGTWHVPQGKYFFVGDDRSHSCDSRVWGPVPRGNLIGPILLTYWPPLRLSFL